MHASKRTYRPTQHREHAHQQKRTRRRCAPPKCLAGSSSAGGRARLCLRAFTAREQRRALGSLVPVGFGRVQAGALHTRRLQECRRLRRTPLRRPAATVRLPLPLQQPGSPRPSAGPPHAASAPTVCAPPSPPSRLPQSCVKRLSSRSSVVERKVFFTGGSPRSRRSGL